MAFLFISSEEIILIKKEKCMECDSCGKKFIKTDSEELELQESASSEFGFIDVNAICPACEALMLDIING